MGVEVVAFISVWLRLYIRWTTLGGFESDDWAILAAVVSQSDVISRLELTPLQILYIPFWAIGRYGKPCPCSRHTQQLIIVQSASWPLGVTSGPSRPTI
jgi:hypothetical protein